MSDTIKPRPLTIKAYLAYGAGDLYGGGTFFLVTTFCMYYLVNVIGMHPIIAGLVPAVGKVWDAVSDPMMGYIADNTPHNRFGKRRVWFLVSIVPIAVSFMLIWAPTNIPSETGRFIFYLVAYLLFFTVQTVSYIPYAALSAEMTVNFSERNKLNSYRLLFSFIATLLAGLLAQPIINAYGGSKQGYFIMGCVFGIIFALPWITLYLGTWELPAPPRTEQYAGSFIKNFLSLFKNKSCRIHIALYVCSYGALDIFMSLVLFYFVDYLDKGSVFIIAQGSLLIMMIVMLPFYNKVATTKGHGTAYIIGLTTFAIGLLLMSLQKPDTPNIFLILNVILMGAGISGGNLIPHQLLPFVSDIDRLITGRNRAGTYSAAMSLTRKLFLGGIVMTVLGAMLAGIGYKNPVPSVLTQPQFDEALALCAEKGKETEPLYKCYLKLPDGNWHLRYMTQDMEYLKTEPKDFVSGEDLLALKVFFDEIKFAHIGIGAMQKPRQKESTLTGVRFFFVLLPLIMLIAGIACALRFKVTPKTHAIILAEIERLDAGGKKDEVTPETKRVCELLTGMPYEKLRVDG